MHDAGVLPVALSVAGSDPSGGAGIQADLKVFQAHRVHGCAVLSLVTVQNTRGVERAEPLAAELLAAQLRALLVDLPPDAIKTGALGGAAQVEALVSTLQAHAYAQALVVDPVLRSTSGATLIDAAGAHALRTQLLPLATLLTPNLSEAALLAQRPVHDLQTARDAARAIAQLGPRAVLIKGGHRRDARDAVDVLYEGGNLHELAAPRIGDGDRFHGLGCALSASITARLARGDALLSACSGAKAWLTRAIENAPDFGGRRGPIDFAAPAVT